MTEQTKWPKHIEACIKASLELGPDVRFNCSWYHNVHLSYVMDNQSLLWEVSTPSKPDIEQWGNEYDQGESSGSSVTWWHSTLVDCIGSRHNPTCISMHHRIIDGETGKLKFSEVTSIFPAVSIFQGGVKFSAPYVGRHEGANCK